MKIECGLTGGVYGLIFMTDAARQSGSKSSAAQSCSRAAAAVQRTCQSRHRVGARMFDLASAGHRYIQTAQQLKQPIPVSESKLAFTVKLPRSLIPRVRQYARARELPVSEVVTRALRALVQR